MTGTDEPSNITEAAASASESDLSSSSSSSLDGDGTAEALEAAPARTEKGAGGSAPAQSLGPFRTKYDVKWDDAYRRLCAYRKRHGHTNISYRCKEDPMLGRWGA
jgi:Helicase associated domain